MRPAGIIDVALAAGVSASTVSRCFNHPGLVSAPTRRRVEEAVRRLGYIRNRAAQTIHGRRSGTIGLVVPTVDHAIFAELIQSFSDAVEARGFTILLASHAYDLEREHALVRKMLEHRVDAMALVGLSHLDETLDLLTRREMPSVLLWNHREDAALPCIGADNRDVGLLIGRHLGGLGHRAVASIFPPRGGNDRAAERHEGLRRGLAACGARLGEGRETPYSVAAAKAAAIELLDRPDPPGAIACGNDVLAWGALHAAARLGIPVPGRLSVTGAGDFTGSAEFEPALTTVHIPARRIGQRAADAVADRLASGAEAITGCRLEPELRIRGTTGPAA